MRSEAAVLAVYEEPPPHHQGDGTAEPHRFFPSEAYGGLALEVAAERRGVQRHPGVHFCQELGANVGPVGRVGEPSQHVTGEGRLPAICADALGEESGHRIAEDSLLEAATDLVG